VDYSLLIEKIRDNVRSSGQPLLRIYWFDGALDGVPQPEHLLLRRMPRVTIRLGKITRNNGRIVRKGVDAMMHSHLTELARNRACSDIVLIAGESDLLTGFLAAKDYGVTMHLWGIEAVDGRLNQSEDLIAEADEYRVLDRSWFTPAVRVAKPAEVQDAPDAPLADHTVQEGIRTGFQHAPLSTHSLSSPLAHPHHLSTFRAPSTPQRGSDKDALPTLAKMTSSEQALHDRKEDGEHTSRKLEEIAIVYCRRWIERLPRDRFDESMGALISAKPAIPRQIDSEFLRYASRFEPFCNRYSFDEESRVTLRAEFWKSVATVCAELNLMLPLPANKQARI